MACRGHGWLLPVAAVASSRDVRSPRHVGRVTDPLVRDDGVDEPEIEVDAGVAGDDEVGGFPVPRRVGSAPAELSPSMPPMEALAPPLMPSSGHPVRDRLLAKAMEARGAGAEPASSGEELLGSFTDELDRVASRGEPPASPALAVRRRELPPNVIALFGALFGLALIGALFAVLIHLDPRDGSPVVATSPIAATTATASPEPTLAPTTAPPAPTAKKPERNRVPGPWRIADSTDAKLKKVDGSIGHDSFLKAMETAGVPHAQTFRVLKVMKELRDLNHCNPRDQFLALVDRASSRVVAFEYVVSKEEVYQAREGADGLLKSAKLDLAVERARVQGAVRFDRETLAASIEAGGFERPLLAVMDEALAGHSSVADLRRGDRLRVVAQEVTVLGEFERYAGIEAMEVMPAHEGDKPLRIYYFRGSKLHGYFDAEGRAVHEGGWQKPIKGAPVTSHFNPKRMHPILHKIMPHQGTDFGAAMGTPVGAAGPGVVSFIGNEGPGGNIVKVQHSAGIETGYAHLSRFEPGLKVGDRVSATQIVGYVGSTGRSTGPHLHFSVKKNGVFVDAEATLRFDALRAMPLEERVEFSEARAKLDALLDAIPLLPPLVEHAPPAAVAAATAAPEEDIGIGEAVPPPPATPVAAGAPPGTAPAAAPPTAPTPAAPAPAPGGGAKAPSIYLSDQDLLKGQAATDDGEVDE
jgi:murein DD-endopeptidase MepM/ murein hydrolase activator NlpD